MTLRDALNQNKGIGPGFHLLRHVLSVSIVLFHCRQVVYWQHSANLLAQSGVTDVAAFVQASQNGPVHFTIEEIFRPAFHAMLGMFFGLSGFLIAGSALRSVSIGNFFANRALRIFPALSVETLLSALILGPIVTQLTLWQYFSNREFFRYFGNIIGWVYFYLPGVFINNPLPRTVNGQLWTLPIELYCYMAMLICLAIKILKRPRLVLTMGIAAVAVMLILNAYDPAHFNPKCQNFFAAWYIFAIFWFGVVFFLNAGLVNLNKYIFAICILLYWATVFFNFATPLSGIFLTYCMVFIGFTKFPWWDRLVKSDYSYGLFLYHFPIMQAYMYFLAPRWENIPLIGQFAMIVALSVPTTLAFAALSWRFIEKPALSLRSVFARTRAVTPDDQITVNPGLSDAFAIAPVN